MSDLATQQPRVAGPSSKRSPKFKPPRVPASLTNGPWPTLEGPEKERRPKRQPYGEKDAGDEALLRGRHLKALLFAHGGFMSARGHKPRLPPAGVSKHRRGGDLASARRPKPAASRRGFSPSLDAFPSLRWRN